MLGEKLRYISSCILPVVPSIHPLIKSLSGIFWLRSGVNFNDLFTNIQKYYQFFGRP